VIDVAYCADIYMGFAAIKFFLGHFFLPLSFLLCLVWFYLSEKGGKKMLKKALKLNGFGAFF